MKNQENTNSNNTPFFLLILSGFICVLDIFIVKNCLQISNRSSFNKPFLSQRISSPLDKKCFATVSTSMVGFLPSFFPAPRDASNLSFSSSQALVNQIKPLLKNSSRPISNRQQLSVFAKKKDFKLQQPNFGPNAWGANEYKMSGKGSIEMGNPIFNPKLEADIHMTYDASQKAKVWQTEKKEYRKDMKMLREQDRKDKKEKRKRDRDDQNFALQREKQNREQDRKDKKLAHELSLSSGNFKSKNDIDDETMKNNEG